MLWLKFFCGSEFGFPILLQLPGDQSIFGLNRLILTWRPLCFVVGPFQPQFPWSLDAGVFLFQLLKRFERDSDFIRLEGQQYLPFNLGVYLISKNALTSRLAQFSRALIANVRTLFPMSAAITRP
jgi:hypothetical protein